MPLEVSTRPTIRFTRSVAISSLQVTPVVFSKGLETAPDGDLLEQLRRNLVALGAVAGKNAAKAIS